MNHSEKNREQQRLQMSKLELIERILRIHPEEGSKEVFPGFFLARTSKPVEAQSVYQPAFCFVVQGSKRVLLGNEIFRYDPGNYLIYTVDLPMIFKVEEASKERPYLGFRLNLDATLVASVMMESGIEVNKGEPNRGRPSSVFNT